MPQREPEREKPKVKVKERTGKKLAVECVVFMFVIYSAHAIIKTEVRHWYDVQMTVIRSFSGRSSEKRVRVAVVIDETLDL